MSMSAQQASQVTPDIDVCKNPSRQRSPKRNIIIIRVLTDSVH